MRRMTRTVITPRGRDRYMGIMVLVTDKRYVYYMRTSDSIDVGAVVDETGAVIGGVKLQDGQIMTVPISVSNEVATVDRAYWAKELASTTKTPISRVSSNSIIQFPIGSGFGRPRQSNRGLCEQRPGGIFRAPETYLTRDGRIDSSTGNHAHEYFSL